MTGNNTYQITFQMVSLYDSSAEKFVTRVSNHLRDTLGIIYEFSKLKINKNKNNKNPHNPVGSHQPPLPFRLPAPEQPCCELP